MAIALNLYFPVNANGAEWQDIEKRGNLIIGVKDNLRPLGFTDNNGNLQGFEIDIARRLAQELFGDSQAVKLRLFPQILPVKG